jgi:hypothetical protein
MRQTEASGWIVRNSSRTMRAVGLAIVPFCVGLAMTAAPARAGDADDRTISEKIMDGFYGTVRGTNMDNRGIDYRERSPLVVPPKLDLPPPAASTEDVKIANWPKDPDERQRKAIIAAKKKNAPPPARVQTTVAAAPGAGAPRPINIAPPVEEPVAPSPDTIRPAYGNERNGTTRTDPAYDQAGDLFNGGAAKALLPDSVSDAFDVSSWFGRKKADPAAVAQPGTEPTREALTQPPIGYQTPSPNYPYALESKGIFGGQSNPDRNPLAQRSSETSVVH